MKKSSRKMQADKVQYYFRRPRKTKVLGTSAKRLRRQIRSSGISLRSQDSVESQSDVSDIMISSGTPEVDEINQDQMSFQFLESPPTPAQKEKLKTGAEEFEKHLKGMVKVAAEYLPQLLMPQDVTNDKIKRLELEKLQLKSEQNNLNAKLESMQTIISDIHEKHRKDQMKLISAKDRTINELQARINEMESKPRCGRICREREAKIQTLTDECNGLRDRISAHKEEQEIKQNTLDEIQNLLVKKNTKRKGQAKPPDSKPTSYISRPR